MVKRDLYLNKLKSFRDNKLIKVVTGLRRCGKSTLLQLFKAELLRGGVRAENIIEINFELMEYDNIRDYREFYELIKSKMPQTGKCYVLLDEVQQVKHWEKAVNSLNVEQNIDCDIYVTGSNAFMLSSDISTLLSGRYVEIKMLPLSFAEFLQFEHLPKNMSADDKFLQYLKHGSLPIVTSLPQEDAIVNDVLMGIYNTVVVKDIIARSRGKDAALLERIMRFVISNTGNILSPNKISGFLSSRDKGESVTPATITNYLEMLEKAYIVYRVDRYDVNSKEQLKTLSKYYVSDTGIRNALMGYANQDIGRVLETVVYFELLRRGYQVYVGKYYDKEVDFLAIRQDTRTYYQVSLSLADEQTKSRELAPLMAIRDNYEKIILTLDKTYITDNEGIKYGNLIEFLLSDCTES